MDEFRLVSGTTRILNADKSVFATVSYSHRVRNALTTAYLYEDVGYVRSRTFRPDTRAIQFHPEPAPLVVRPHAQQVIREVRDHVHDPDWCYGKPKSITGFAKDLPPLWNGVSRTDTFRAEPIGTPEQSDAEGVNSPEYHWLVAHTYDEPHTTLQLLHEHQAEGTLLTDELAEAIADSEDEGETGYPEPIGLTDPPVVRRIEWEREQAQTGPVTKFYLKEGAGGSDDVTWWQRRGTEPPPNSILVETMQRVLAYAQEHQIRWFDAVLRRDEMIGRRAAYGVGWQYSLLKPLTLKTHFDRSTEAGRARNDLFWELRQPDIEDPYRETLTFLDDDLHRPEPSFRISRRPEIQQAQWEAAQKVPVIDEYFMERDRFGKWRLQQRFVDILAIEGFSINSAPAIGWDDDIPLRDNEKRIVVSNTRNPRTGKVEETFHYSQWSTERRTDLYRGRKWDGKEPFATVIRPEPTPVGDNYTCRCRWCYWSIELEAYRARLAAIIKRSA